MSKTYTQHYNLTKDGKEEFYDVAVANGNMDIVDTALHESKTKITGLETEMTAARGGEANLNARLEKIDRQQGDVLVPPIQLGFSMTTIEKKGPYPSMLDVDFATTDYVNLLGRDGNCEDVGKFTGHQASIAIDSTTKVFGSNSIKITSAMASYGILCKSFTFKANQKYLLTAYGKRGSCPDGVFIGCALLTQKDIVGTFSTTNFERIGNKVYSNTDITINIDVFSLCTSSGQTFWVDGLMVTTISDEEYYNDTTQVLLARYPYADSHAMTINPSLSNIKDNLVRNGNCEVGTAYWETSGSGAILSIENGRFKVVNTLGNWVKQRIKVPQNTTLYFSHNVTGVGGEIKTPTSVTLRYGAGAFNTGANEEIDVFYYGASTGTYYFDSVMIDINTEAPTAYKPQRIEECYVEGSFTKQDKLSIVNGKLIGHRGARTVNLDGSLSWDAGVQDYAGFKTIGTKFYMDGVRDSHVGIKYDGSILKSVNWGAASSAANQIFFGGSLDVAEGSRVWLSVSDAESGWTETVNPNADEIKANQNGWKAFTNTGTRYMGWFNPIDYSFPIQTAYSAGVNVSGQNKLNVTNGAMFSINRRVAVRDDSGINHYNINAINGNQLTVSPNLVSNTPDGGQIMLLDNGTSDFTVLNFCKSNRAPNYTPDTITYTLTTPLPLNQETDGYAVDLKGDKPWVEQGYNHVTFKTGVVLGEIAKLYTDGASYCINTFTAGYRDSLLQHPTENVDSVYKNKSVDNKNWTFRTGSYMVNSYGYMDVYTAKQYCDPSATYTINYKILETLAPQIGGATARYTDNLPSALEGIMEFIESKQDKHPVLDTIADKSMYEKITLGSLHLTPVYEFGTLYQSLILPITQKLVKPMISLDSITIRQTNAQIVTSNYKLLGVYYGGTYIKINFLTMDATLIANRTDGAYITCNVTLDCRGVM